MTNFNESKFEGGKKIIDAINFARLNNKKNPM